MSLTVGRLAKKFGLSRSTLLYYDRIGLLSPVVHAKGEYRMYGKKEEKRLELICRYREAGIELKNIKQILDHPETSLTAILNDRFKQLNTEIRNLHEQQKVIAGLLKNSSMAPSQVLTKKVWVGLLKASGFSEDDMRNWHILFEKSAPGKHRAFLQHLQIDEEEITQIRSWVKDNP